ncbi:MAG: SDR family oxidoreductase [Eubacteriales bacterium]|nr:SDR family oxidoreductase [Eubacteriales bacterium]
MINKLFDITGKKAIVTGGTRGLGKGMAEGLMESGCEVVIVGTSDKVYKVAEEFQAKGYNCHGVKGDLSDRDDCNKCFGEAVDILGDLDILVTAHGIQRRYPSNEFPDEDWDAVINTNLNSVFWMAKAAANIMKPKGYGKIIMIASMCSFFGGKTIPAYSAAKGGVAQLTKAFSNDLFQYGININAIAPGYMDTEMNVALTDPTNPKFTQQRYEELTQRIPAHRWGTPDDMKGTCLFLASHASDYLGGAIIPVDGGYLVM